MNLADELNEAVRGRGPLIRDGSYDISVGAYGATLDIDVTWWKGRSLQRFDGHGTPKLSGQIWVNRTTLEAMRDDPDLEEDFLSAVARKLRLKPRQIDWGEGAWVRARGGWARSLRYRGAVSAHGVD